MDEQTPEASGSSSDWGDTGLRTTTLTPEQKASIIDSLNYEDRIRSPEVAKDPYPDLLFFPEDDAIVQLQPKPRRTIEPSISVRLLSINTFSDRYLILIPN
jgi:hypothetical protein